MPRDARLDIVQKAICAGHRGQIEWKPSCLERFRQDPDMKGFTDKGVRELLWDSVRNKAWGKRIYPRRMDILVRLRIATDRNVHPTLGTLRSAGRLSVHEER